MGIPETERRAMCFWTMQSPQTQCHLFIQPAGHPSPQIAPEKNHNHEIVTLTGRASQNIENKIIQETSWDFKNNGNGSNHERTCSKHLTTYRLQKYIKKTCGQTLRRKGFAKCNEIILNPKNTSFDSLESFSDSYSTLWSALCGKLQGIAIHNSMGGIS